MASRILWAMLAARHGQLAAWWKGFREELPPAAHKPGDQTSRERTILDQVLIDSERELYRLQKETGFDWYWKMYFSLFPPSP